jgi:hypothetical protein
MRIFIPNDAFFYRGGGISVSSAAAGQANRKLDR